MLKLIQNLVSKLCLKLKLYSADKLSGQALGKLLKEKYDLKWTDVTTQYSGNKLNSWAKWVKSYEVKNE